MTNHDTLSSETTPPKKEAALLDRLPVRGLLAIVAALVLTAWLLNTPPGAFGKADAVGYAVCHQIFERSFKVNGQPISLCARCTGMYVGALIGIVYQLFLGRRRAAWPEKKYLVLLALFFVAFGIDGANSAAKLFLGRGPLYEPNNTLRLITGTGMGLTMAAMILPTFQQTVWASYAPRSYFSNWKQFAGMLALGYGSAALILTERPVVLLPFSYLGALGVIVLLVMLYLMILMVIFNRENIIERPGQLVPWLLAGLIVAFLHIGLFDLGRYLLTGTWEGFHINLS